MLSTFILTAKDYKNLLGISYSTAKKEINHDKKFYNKKRITVMQFCRIYGFEPKEVLNILNG